MHPNDRPPPYVGITGFMSSGEIHDLRCSTKGFNHLTDTRPLMCGILASDKTLRHEPHARPNRYPLLEDLHRITLNNRRTGHDASRFLFFIHYASKTPGLAGQLLRLTEVAGFIDGFQLNIAWPDIEELRIWRKTVGMTSRLVIQVGAKAYRQAGGAPETLRDKLLPYAEVATDFLLDMSGGEGVMMEPSTVLPILRTLNESFWATKRLGIAGGLGPDTLGLAETVMREFPDVSIDAEGRLRDANDHLDLVKARGYLERAGELCDRHYGVDDMR